MVNNPSNSPQLSFVTIPTTKIAALTVNPIKEKNPANSQKQQSPLASFGVFKARAATVMIVPKHINHPIRRIPKVNPLQ